MKLDYNANALGGPAYVLYLPRGEGDPAHYMREYGLDLSAPATTAEQAVLYTRSPYAAVSFHEHATPTARAQLGYIVEQVEKSWAPSSNRHIDLPRKLLDEGIDLWPFQRACVDYLMSRPHGIDGDEMGLGKTATAIACANEMQAQRVLIVCPAVIRFQWMEEWKRWSTMGDGREGTYKVENPLIYAITSSKYGIHETAAVTIISWDLIRNPALHEALTKNADGSIPHYDLLILDEAHMAKTIDAKRTQAIFGGALKPVAPPIASRCKKIIALTGTPLQNRPGEAYVLAHHLCPEAIDWMGHEAFMDAYNPLRKGKTDEGKVYTDEKVGRLPELQNRLRSHLLVRHLKADVVPQLKLPAYDLIRCEETAAIKAALKAEHVLQIDPENLEGADITILGAVSTARLQMGLAIAPQVVNWVKMLMDGGSGKIVMFAWHKQVMTLLCEGLADYGIIRVDGSDSGKRKQAKIHKFITDPKAQIILGNVLSLGTGTDGLQHVSTHVLMAESDWVMGNNQQCIDRVSRMGQEGQVQADFFVAPNSLSEKVLATALRKAHTVHRALDRRVGRDLLVA